MTTRDSNGIDHFIFRKDRGNRDRMFKELIAEVDLVRYTLPAIDLDLHQVRFLLMEMLQLANLSMCNETNHWAVLFHSIKLVGNLLAVRRSDAGRIFGESLLLALIPVLDKTTTNFFTEVASKNGAESSKTTRCFHITNKANSDHGRSLDDRDRFNSFLHKEESCVTERERERRQCQE